MSIDTTELVIAGIRGLARAIHDEAGMYVHIDEAMHSSAQSVSVSIQTRAGEEPEFAWFRGSTAPAMQREVTLEQMRDELGDWLANYRKGREVA